MTPGVYFYRVKNMQILLITPVCNIIIKCTKNNKNLAAARAGDHIRPKSALPSKKVATASCNLGPLWSFGGDSVCILHSKAFSNSDMI